MDHGKLPLLSMCTDQMGAKEAFVRSPRVATCYFIPVSIAGFSEAVARLDLTL